MPGSRQRFSVKKKKKKSETPNQRAEHRRAVLYGLGVSHIYIYEIVNLHMTIKCSKVGGNMG